MKLERFTWKEAYSTGIRSVDVQHKELFHAVNDLADTIEYQNCGEVPIKKLMSFMGYYAEWHFGHEEKCFHGLNCPLAAANQEAHQQFLDTFTLLRQEAREGGVTVDFALKIHKILSTWLVNHILKIDTQIKPSVPETS